jgi:hypothetical protein
MAPALVGARREGQAIRWVVSPAAERVCRLPFALKRLPLACKSPTRVF